MTGARVISAGKQATLTSREKDGDLDWRDYQAKGFRFSAFPPGGMILDVGCGGGTQMQHLQRCRCRGVGLDVDRASLARCRARNLPVAQAEAEHIPFKSASVDGVICKVVLPYTDERSAIREIGRVLKEGSVGRCCYHGVGYYLRYLVACPSWKARFYGLRTLVNTWLYAMAGLRLPGFLGDTLYQSQRRLTRYYAENNLRLRESTPSRTFAGCPVFIYHTIEKIGR